MTKADRLLKQCLPHLPPQIAKKVREHLGPQREETLSEDDLWECLIESVDARDQDEALHFSQRILDKRASV